uniref:Mediator complex subunit 16 C-terminal domain-containing protein n=1 Tax=Salvator merianae TaxID=96440 RepID=A0A8D0E314_SALMN
MGSCTLLGCGHGCCLCSERTAVGSVRFWDALATLPSCHTDTLCWTPGQPKIDHLRRLYLGAYPTEECKSCTRCGCVTMLRSPNKATAVKQWEQRWIKNCLCGGLWRRMPLSYA